MLGALLALLLALVAAAWWAWRSDAGPAWVLEQVPGLKITGMQGRPDGGPFGAQRVEWQSGGTQLRIEGLAWRNLHWQWRPYPGAWLRVEVLEPRAARVQVTTAPKPAAQAPQGPPQDLRLPVELVVRGLQADALHVNDQPPVLGLRGDLHLGADHGRQHRIGPIEAQRDPAQARLEARIATIGPLGVEGTVRANSLPGAAPPWQAGVRLGGTVARLALDGTLTAGTGARVGVQATLTPFEAWPLAALQATAEGLDLSALQASLPVTSLSGRAVLTSSGPDAPMSADLDLRNAQPGAWDASHLPLRRLRATLSGNAAQPHGIDFTIVEAALHGQAEAGQLTGRGQWQGHALSLSLVLDGVQPARIDSRAAPMTLGGPLRLSLRGLPSPAPGSAPGSAPAAATALSGELHADLTGRLQREPAPPLRLVGDATFSAPPDQSLQASVPRLELSAADARAALSAEVRRDAGQVWQVRSDGSLVRFDPADWWAGPAGSAWRRGAHDLNGRWKADATWPQAAAPQTPTTLLRALRGRAELSLAPSRLAGVPMSGSATLQAGDRATQIDGALRAGNNRASAQWLVDDSTGERWQLDLRAPALGTLAPLGRLVPGADAWVPKAGTLDAHLVAQGRWPAPRTEGRVRAGGVQSGAWRIGRLDARWNATPGVVDAPLALHLTGSGLAQGEQRIETIEAHLSGTLAAHRLQLRAASPLRPPAWTDAVISAAPSRGTALHLAAAGGWTPVAPAGGVWRGRIEELTAVAQPRTGTPWIEARGLTGEVRLGPQGFEQAALQPGRLRLLGATLQWTEARAQAGARGAPPLIALDARLDPLPVAPWLRQAQPHFGWEGDLRVGATMRVTSGERLDADVVVERAGGDLTLTDDTGTRSLGLTDLRLSLAAHDGLWQLTQAVAGRQVGVLSGAQSVRAASASAWPTADAPLQGTMELRVADLTPWSAWLPPGWSVGGRLHAGGALAGQLGAPRYTGEVTGSELSVRNLLQGVYMHDGALALSLRGDEARLERLVFRAGEGTLRVDGTASLGDAPSAQLRIVAQHFQALARLDRRLSLSGQAGVELAPERLGVQGRFMVDEGLIDVSQAGAPRLDDDVTVLNRPAGEPAAAPQEPPRSPWKNTSVSLLVDLGDDLQLVGRGLKAGLRGQLRITTPEGLLQVHGTVRTEGGTYTAYGQNLAIERGVITLAGDVTSPRIDILAVRPDVDVRVGVTVQGPALQPRVRLYSEPEMSEMDKLSWLVMGRASEGLGRADTALLQRAALALLAGERSGESPGLVERLGLDDLSVKRGESGELADTVVTLGKQISQRWYVAYERGLNAAAGSWQLIYRVARRYTLRLQAGEARGLDLIWTWRWN